MDGQIIISPIYDGIFTEDTSSTIVKLGGKYGFIDKTGNILIEPIFDDVGSLSEGFASFLQYSQGKRGYLRLFNDLEDYITYHLRGIESENDYVKPRVQYDILNWSQKDEFEKTTIWKERILNQKEPKIRELICKYKQEYKVLENEYNKCLEALTSQYYYLKETLIRKHFKFENLHLSRYDADNETFLITVDEKYAELVLHVPLDIARDFKENWDTIRKSIELEFHISDDIDLKSLTFTFRGDKIIYDSSSKYEYCQSVLYTKCNSFEISIDDSVSLNASE